MLAWNLDSGLGLKACAIWFGLFFLFCSKRKNQYNKCGVWKTRGSDRDLGNLSNHTICDHLCCLVERFWNHIVDKLPSTPVRCCID